MTRPIRLRPTGLEQQFRDDKGRLWVSNDTRKPGSNPPDPLFCWTCCGFLGPVVYMEQSTGGTVACEDCVEVTS